MKKFIGLFGVIFLAMPFFGIAKPAQAAEFAGGCSSSSTYQVPVDSNNIVQQYLKPTKNTISGITVKGFASAIFNVTMIFQKFENNQLKPPLATQTFDRQVAGETPYNLVISGLSLSVDTNSFYAITVFANSGTYYPYVDDNPNCDPVGYADVSNVGESDVVAYLTGYDATTPDTSSTPAATTTTAPASISSSTSSTASNSSITATPATVAEAPVAPSLATPLNFKVDRNLGEEIIFSWTPNSEPDLAGYSLQILKGEEVIETIEIGDKALDNYSLRLNEHTALALDTQYSAKLSAKNSAGALSATTEPARFTFEKRETTKTATIPWYESSLILSMIGLGIIILVLVILQWKLAIFSKLFRRMKGKK